MSWPQFDKYYIKVNGAKSYASPKGANSKIQTNFTSNAAVATYKTGDVVYVRQDQTTNYFGNSNDIAEGKKVYEIGRSTDQYSGTRAYINISQISSTKPTTQSTTTQTPSSTNTKPKTSSTTVVNGTVLPNSNIYSQFTVKAADGLNIRQSTNANSNILGSLPNGTRIYAKPATATGWSEYSQDGKFPSGYVSSKYIEKIPGTDPIPPPDPNKPPVSNNVTPPGPTLAPIPTNPLPPIAQQNAIFQANQAAYLTNLEDNNILQQDLKNVAALLDPLKTAALSGNLNKDTLKSFGNQLWETEKQKLIKAGTDNELIALYKTKYELITKELQLEAEHAIAVIKLKYLRTPKAVLTNAATGSERTANAGDVVRGEGTLGETGSFGPTLTQQLNNQRVVTNSGTVDEATLRLNEAIAGANFIPSVLKFEIPTSIGDLYPVDQKVIDNYLATPTSSRPELTVANLYESFNKTIEAQTKQLNFLINPTANNFFTNQRRTDQNGNIVSNNPLTGQAASAASLANGGVVVNNSPTQNTNPTPVANNGTTPVLSKTGWTLPGVTTADLLKNFKDAQKATAPLNVFEVTPPIPFDLKGIDDYRINQDAAIRWLKLWLAEDTSYNKNKSDIKKAQEVNDKAIDDILSDPFKKIKEGIKKRKEARDELKRRSKKQKRSCRKRRAKKLAKSTVKTITPILISFLSNKLIDVVAQNNKIRALVEKTNNYILLYEGEDPIFIYTNPSSLYIVKQTVQGITSAPPITLSFAKKVRDNAIKIINTNRKNLNNVNKGIENTQKYVSIFNTVVTIISSIPIPTSVPPGVGVPVSLIMKYVKILDKANRIVQAISNYLPQVVTILEQAIEKLNDYESQILAINEKLDNAVASGVNDTPAMLGPAGQNASGTTDPAVDGVEYQGFRFAIREEDTIYGPKALKRHYAVAIDANDTEVLQSERSFTLDPEDLVEQLKVVIDRRKLSAGVRIKPDGQTQNTGSLQVAGNPDGQVIANLSNPYYLNQQSSGQSISDILQQTQQTQQQQQQQAQQIQQQQYQQQHPPLTTSQRLYYQSIVMNSFNPPGERSAAQVILNRNYI